MPARAEKRRPGAAAAAPAAEGHAAAAACGGDGDSGDGAAAPATRADLAVLWQSLGGRKRKVAGFYSLKCRLKQFSNFFEHEPFVFELPECARRDGYPREVSVAFSEKAIMLCKASLFDDRDAFDAIAAASTPARCKRLGRGVRGFDEGAWQASLLRIAESVVTQKFAKVDGLAAVLLSTGRRLLAEAAPSDAVWGVGLALGDGRLDDPGVWRGTNVLGWALMRARAALGGVGVPEPDGP